MKRLIKPFAIIGGVFLALFPWIFKSEIYTCLTISSDSKKHAEFINAVANNLSVKDISGVYPAQIWFGYILGWIDKVIHVAPIVLFSVFALMCLVGTGFAIYYVVSRLVDKTTGIIAVIVGIGTTNTIFFLFRYGVEYSLLDMYIVLPLAIFCLIKWLTTKKWWYIVVGLILMALFSSLHLVTMYMPYMMAFIFILLASYWIIKRKNMIRFAILAVIVLGINVLFYKLFLASSVEHSMSDIVHHISGEAVVTYSSFWAYVLDLKRYILPVPTIIGLGVAYYAIKYRKLLNLNTETKYLLFILGSMAVTLLGGGILGITGHPDRLMLDGITLLALCMTILLGKIWQLKNVELSWAKMGCYVFIGSALFAKLIEWVRF